MKRFARSLAVAVTGTGLLAATGCRSYWIDAEVINQTGKPVHELEVAYPTASFGTNLLLPGSTMHYRFQIRGSGTMKVEYTFENGKTAQAQGLNLQERQQGHLTIRLFPDGKVDFEPQLEPAS